MATKKPNPAKILPKQWTTAKVRVNPQGKVQVKIAKNKVTGGTFKVIHSGNSMGYRYRHAIKTFKSREAAQRFANMRNSKPNKEGFYSVE